MSTNGSERFEPRVLVLCCLYCAYAAADVAGTLRRSYPECVRVMRVPCTGRVDAIDLLKAFEAGADGVLVVGCVDGQCHFKEGNRRGRRTARSVQEMLEKVGVGAERLQFHGITAAMGSQFAEIVTAAVERFRALGPSPVKRPSCDRDATAAMEKSEG